MPETRKEKKGVTRLDKRTRKNFGHDWIMMTNRSQGEASMSTWERRAAMASCQRTLSLIRIVLKVTPRFRGSFDAVGCCFVFEQNL